MSMDPGKIGTIKVLDKAAAILQVLRERERVTPADLVETVGESRTTVVRICETLVRHGLLEREDSSRVSYRLGLTLLELGALTRQRLSIRDVAHPVLVELSAKTGDSTNLVVRRDDAAVCLIRVVGSYPVVSQALYEGGRLPYDRGGSSLALLAFGDAELQESVLARLEPDRRPALRDRLQEIREAGYCVSRGEFLPETGAVGAPVFGVHGDHAIAGVSVSGVVGPAGRRPPAGADGRGHGRRREHQPRPGLQRPVPPTRLTPPRHPPPIPPPSTPNPTDPHALAPRPSRAEHHHGLRQPDATYVAGLAPRPSRAGHHDRRRSGGAAVAGLAARPSPAWWCSRWRCGGAGFVLPGFCRVFLSLWPRPPVTSASPHAIAHFRCAGPLTGVVRLAHSVRTHRG
ncbi:IclR family transcriptional regulator [Actinomadura madurae]|uniref:IclR family transcriptional regulator n=1 Tax=Actinomadura madurae TaxID=1993 RepID=UPI0020D1FB87|nr:IclR family transcriptional regulator [Actinomadura madurae]MCP9953549.1 IclR family transcriptional regulator [Actinomadura madurae]